MQTRILLKADTARKISLNPNQEKLNISSLTKEDKFVNKNEAREILNISLTTLDRHTLRGNLKSYKVGIRVLYRESEIRSHKILFKKILRKKNATRKPSIGNRIKTIVK